MLSLSSIPVLDAMGKTVAIGVLCGYLMAFAFSRPVAAARL